MVGPPDSTLDHCFAMSALGGVCKNDIGVDCSGVKDGSQPLGDPAWVCSPCGLLNGYEKTDFVKADDVKKDVKNVVACVKNRKRRMASSAVAKGIASKPKSVTKGRKMKGSGKHKCPQCHKHFTRPGFVTRHIKEAHSADLDDAFASISTNEKCCSIPCADGGSAVGEMTMEEFMSAAPAMSKKTDYAFHCLICKSRTPLSYATSLKHMAKHKEDGLINGDLSQWALIQDAHKLKNGKGWSLCFARLHREVKEACAAAKDKKSDSMCSTGNVKPEAKVKVEVAADQHVVPTCGAEAQVASHSLSCTVSTQTDTTGCNDGDLIAFLLDRISVLEQRLAAYTRPVEVHKDTVSSNDGDGNGQAPLQTMPKAEPTSLIVCKLKPEDVDVKQERGGGIKVGMATEVKKEQCQPRGYMPLTLAMPRIAEGLMAQAPEPPASGECHPFNSIEGFAIWVFYQQEFARTTKPWLQIATEILECLQYARVLKDEHTTTQVIGYILERLGTSSDLSTI